MTSTAEQLLHERFGSGPVQTIAVPGRVNLIGEHIDYHNLPVLPMAIQRRITIAFRPRTDSRVRAVSALNGHAREFEWTPVLEPSPAGDWANYIKAAAQAISAKWSPGRGIDAAIVSDLPPAAGLSSSSALLTGFTLALLQANGVVATFEDLMSVLPEGEYFVGTRGGGMDHAAVLAGRAGSAVLVNFVPLSAKPVPIPPGWAFLIAHSLTMAEKSGAVREEYNSRRVAGTRALEKLGFATYAEVVDRRNFEDIVEMAGTLPDADQRSFVHVGGEAIRVRQAVRALENADASEFGRLLSASHASLRHLLRVSNPALDNLVDCATQSGALGARLTGAGFGGCVIVFCAAGDVDSVRSGIKERFYGGCPTFREADHLITAEASAGALDLE